MELEDLRDKYKILPMWSRVLIAVVIGILPGVYIYLDEGQILEDGLIEAESQLDAARVSFEAARKKKQELPKLEAELIFTEEQLAKAKQKLPDAYKIEEILHDAASIAKKTGVKLKNFKPGIEQVRQEAYPYVELPIATEIEGSFNQVASFLDMVVHLEGSIFVRQLELNRLTAKDRETRTEPGAVQTYEEAKAARQGVRVASRFDIVVYRGVGPQDAVPEPTHEDGAKEKDKPGKAEAKLETRHEKAVAL